LVAVWLALGISGCAAVDAARSAEVEKQKSFEQRIDTAHIWVTTQAPSAGKPYSTLGELSYTELFSPEAIDEAKISDKLKKIALQKWPDTIDAIVDENQTVSTDGSQITVTGKAIHTILRLTAPPCITLTRTWSPRQAGTNSYRKRNAS
jgi:hypothetical protein